MLRNKNTKINLLFAVGLIFSLSFTSCSSDRKSGNKKNAESEFENLDIDKDILDDIETAKKIFYSLPSPVETAVILKNAGAKYNEELLNGVESADNYTTNKSMALNLGVYTTDMSFASLFDKTQTTINYMEAAKKMADGLGILDAIDDNTITRLEQNINDRDIIMDIISESFMNSSSYLKEYDRAPVATIVLVGGWIEGLYIATQLVQGESIKNNKIVDRVVEQKLSWEILQKLLDQHQADTDIQSLNSQLGELRSVFEKIEIETSATKVIEGNENESATLTSTLEYTITPEIFQELTTTIKTLRSNFIL